MVKVKRNVVNQFNSIRIRFEFAFVLADRDQESVGHWYLSVPKETDFLDLIKSHKQFGTLQIARKLNRKIV